MKITYNEMLKECRKELKILGLQVKDQRATINGMKAFKIVDRNSGSIVDQNFTLTNLYENVLNGYFETL